MAETLVVVCTEYARLDSAASLLAKAQAGIIELLSQELHSMSPDALAKLSVCAEQNREAAELTETTMAARSARGTPG